MALKIGLGIEMNTSAGKTIAAIINRYVEKDAALSLRGIAAKIGLNPGHLSRILSGKRKLCLETAFAICLSLELSESDTEDLLYIVVKSEAEESVRKVQKRLFYSNFVSRSISKRIIERTSNFLIESET